MRFTESRLLTAHVMTTRSCVDCPLLSLITRLAAPFLCSKGQKRERKEDEKGGRRTGEVVTRDRNNL